MGFIYTFSNYKGMYYSHASAFFAVLIKNSRCRTTDSSRLHLSCLYSARNLHVCVVICYLLRWFRV
jgi:hypothetical protein